MAIVNEGTETYGIKITANVESHSNRIAHEIITPGEMVRKMLTEPEKRNSAVDVVHLNCVVATIDKHRDSDAEQVQREILKKEQDLLQGLTTAVTQPGGIMGSLVSFEKNSLNRQIAELYALELVARSKTAEGVLLYATGNGLDNQRAALIEARNRVLETRIAKLTAECANEMSFGPGISNNEAQLAQLLVLNAANNYRDPKPSFSVIFENTLKGYTQIKANEAKDEASHPVHAYVSALEKYKTAGGGFDIANRLEA